MSHSEDVKNVINEKVDEVVDDLYENSLNELKSRLEGTDININNIMFVVKYAMEIVEATKLKGKAQKEFANKLIRQIIVDAPISDDKEQLLLTMVDEGVLADTIEMIVLASRGKLNINRVKKCFCLNIKKFF